MLPDGVPDAGGEIVEISTDTEEVWLMQGSKEVFMQQISIDSMLKGDLTKSYAHWYASHQTVAFSDGSWAADMPALANGSAVIHNTLAARQLQDCRMVVKECSTTVA